MAIKTQSQLIKFDNGTSSNEKKIGKNLALFDGNILTDMDKAIDGPKPFNSPGDNWRNVKTNYNAGRTALSIENFATDHFWKSIFEISQPNVPGEGQIDTSIRYDSRSTTYEDIAKNILWDVKSYLNYRNNLNDYNLSDIVDGNQYFYGTKYLSGCLNAINISADNLSAANLSSVSLHTIDLSSTGKIYSNNLTATNLTATNLTATSQLSASNLTAYNSHLTNLTATNLTATSQLSASNLTAYNSHLTNLTATTTASFSCDINMGTNTYVNGYAKGLKKDSHTLYDTTSFDTTFTYWRTRTSIDDNNSYKCFYTQDNNDKTIYLSSLHDTCLPISFKNGEPSVFTCVPYSTALVYQLSSNDDVKFINTKDQASRILNTDINSNDAGCLITSYGGVDLTNDNQFLPNGIVSTFKYGIPYPQNTIGFAYYAKHAFWSDLGEKYLADREYEPGTLVKFGGEKEITIADNEVNAIVSTKAFDLNSCLKDGTVICLCGRVPTKVIGKIAKFDRIMLSKVPGIACKWDGSCKPIGRALESNDDEGIKLVECVSQFMV